MKNRRFKLAMAMLGALLVVGLMAQADLSAASLASRVQLTVSGTYSNVLDLGTAAAPFSATRTVDLANGVGANQADRVFTDTRTIAPSTTEDLDVSGGALTDAFGATFTIAKLKALMICASTTNTNNVVILGDTNSVPILGTAATVSTLTPGACFVGTWPGTAGIAVTASTGDILQVANSGAGTSVTYDIAIIGASS